MRILENENSAAIKCMHLILVGGSQNFGKCEVSGGTQSCDRRFDETEGTRRENALRLLRLTWLVLPALEAIGAELLRVVELLLDADPAKAVGGGDPVHDLAVVVPHRVAAHACRV